VRESEAVNAKGARLVTISRAMLREGAPLVDVYKMLRRNGANPREADAIQREAIRKEGPMPLRRGPSRKAFSENVRTEMAEGKSQRQSVAIAYSEARRTGQKSPPRYRKRRRADKARENALADRRDARHYQIGVRKAERKIAKRKRDKAKGYCSKCSGPHKYKHGKR
jgi:hypothetical protein